MGAGQSAAQVEAVMFQCRVAAAAGIVGVGLAIRLDPKDHALRRDDRRVEIQEPLALRRTKGGPPVVDQGLDRHPGVGGAGQLVDAILGHAEILAVALKEGVEPVVVILDRCACVRVHDPHPGFRVHAGHDGRHAGNGFHHLAGHGARGVNVHHRGGEEIAKHADHAARLQGGHELLNHLATGGDRSDDLAAVVHKDDVVHGADCPGEGIDRGHDRGDAGHEVVQASNEHRREVATAEPIVALAAYAEQRREPGITFARAGGGHGAAGNQGREQAEAELRDRRGVDASLAGANQWREVSASAAEARVNGLVADTGQRGEPPGPGVGFAGAVEQPCSREGDAGGLHVLAKRQRAEPLEQQPKVVDVQVAMS